MAIRHGHICLTSFCMLVCRVGRKGLVKRDELRAMMGEDDGYDSAEDAEDDMMDMMAMMGDNNAMGMPQNLMMWQAAMMQMMAAQQGNQ